MARSHYRALVIAAALLTALAQPAEASRRGADARTDDGGVEVEIEVGEDGEVRGSGGAGGDECEWSTRRYPYTGTEPPARFGSPPSEEHELYLIYCNGEYVSTEWLGPRDDLTDSVAGLVQRVVRDIPVDIATIGVRPQASGVTGIPSLFWVEGYRGEPINRNVNELGVSVDVEVGGDEQAEWDFGDGTPPLRGSLGQPWPERSDVRHAYADKGPKTITVTLELPARYRVDGGDWQSLPPIVRTATLTYDVDEVQAVRNR